MTILVIADDVSVAKAVPKVRADLLASCGDLPDDTIIKIAQRVSASQIVAVKGNHDGSGSFDPRIADLHAKVLTVGGITFGGFAGCWKYKPRGNYLFEQSEVYAALKGFPRVDVFVAHNSPRGVHERDDEVHQGFTAFMTYIADKQPRLFVHGHQHKNAESTIEQTRIVGVYGHQFLVV